MRRRDSYGVWDGYVHTDLFKVDNQQGSTVEHIELCSVLCGSLVGRGVWGEWIHVLCMPESLCYPPETITTLLTGYTPI